MIFNIQYTRGQSINHKKRETCVYNVIKSSRPGDPNLPYLGQRSDTAYVCTLRSFVQEG